MRHQIAGRKLNRTSSHRKALLKNLATALLEHKKIETTEAKAKELRPYVEKLITKAKDSFFNEKQKQLPKGQTIDIHNRRIAATYIRSKAVLQELFDSIAPAVIERPGGYTRIVKTGFRRGDGGKSAIIELVDFSTPVDGNVNLKPKNKAKKIPGKPVAKPVTKEEKFDEEILDEVSTIEEETIEETPVDVFEENQIEEEVKPEEAAVEAQQETTEEPKQAEQILAEVSPEIVTEATSEEITPVEPTEAETKEGKAK